jgi:hypothetical protein
MDMRQQTVDKIIEHLTMYGDPTKDTGRWMPVFEPMLYKIGVDVKTKIGRKMLIDLDVIDSFRLNQQHFTDMELLDLLVITVRRFTVQR